MVPAGDGEQWPSLSFKPDSVSLNADGSLQMEAAGREFRISNVEQGQDQWMAQIDPVGRAALRPLSKALAAQL